MSFFSMGIGHIDPHLLAYQLIEGRKGFWTNDRRLQMVA